MDNASDETSESLIKLFSVRARSVVPTNRPSNSEIGTSLETTTETSEATTAAKTAITTLPRVNNQTGTSVLNAKSAVVLREARRELGKDYSAKSSELTGSPINEESITSAIDKVLKKRNEILSDIQRADLIVHLKKDLSGWGILQPLIDNPVITDIHVYDYQTVVLQRGKESQDTGIRWPTHQAYTSFIDRLLLSLDRSLSTQQHTVDVSLSNGIRICAIHESICGTGGPLLSIRVPRVVQASLETIISYQVAPAPIVDYLGSLIKSGKITMIIAGETGTGKTTLLRCLGTLFGPDESIVSVEDTPELNFQHPFVRSLISRPANMEGVGEVTLQEQIRSTLRMTPTRVVLGEMRTPFSAEAFLESAQTGHVGLSTVHARNARETLVRLESLLGRAQKSVSIDIIRQQIALAVDVIVWLYREKGTGKPRIGEIIEVCHYVEGVIQTRPMFSYRTINGKPTWTVDSWNSSFEEILSKDGIHISRFPQEITFDASSATFLKAAN